MTEYHWTYQEIQSLADMVAMGFTDDRIARVLGRSRSAVSSRRLGLGLPRYSPYGTGLTELKETLSIHVSKDLHERVLNLAHDHGANVSNLVESLIYNFLELVEGYEAHDSEEIHQAAE